VALTPKFAVAVAAEAFSPKLAIRATPLTAAANPRNLFARIALSLLIDFSASRVDAVCLEAPLWDSLVFHDAAWLRPSMLRYKTFELKRCIVRT
jgi:hypothetical protein